MASQVNVKSERVVLGTTYRRAQAISLAVGAGALVVAILLAFLTDPSFRRFYFAYMVSYCFFLTISIGALFFVILQHITRAGWSVNVRRIAEILGCAMPVLVALSAPILISVVENQGKLYRWAQPVHALADEQATVAPAAAERAEAAGAQASGNESAAVEGVSEESTLRSPQSGAILPLDELALSKHAWLNRPFFIARVLFYFAIWSLMAIWYWRRSVEQDQTRDESLSLKMQGRAAPAALILALTVTVAGWDIVMSLDPSWYSTMFGIYFFSGCAVAIFATLIVCAAILQKSGYLTEAITTEHYHDLGKFLFAFVFFWGYIAFSQYMLLWYANIPEEIGWYARRGATTVSRDISGWSVVSLMLLFGHLFIPFAGLLSRHMKRSMSLLVFWAAWMLVFHWVDLYWLIMPELDGRVHFGLMEPLCLIGIGGLYLAAVLRIALRHDLRPVADPRLAESLAFENI